MPNRRALFDNRGALGENARMRVRKLVCAVFPLLLFQFSRAASAAVVTYGAPPDEALSSDYTVTADGKPVDVYAARVLDPPFAGKEWDYGGPYSFANFDMKGTVTVRVTSKRSLSRAVIRPAFADVQMRVEDDHALRIVLRAPRKISIEPDGKRGPLLLFANPIEQNPPKPGDTNVIYFGPGTHRAGLVTLGTGQTLYLAGGAVLRGAITAAGTNIRVAGRGILDGSDYEWRKGPANFTLGISGTNVEVNGITIRGSSHWTLVPRASRDVMVRNVKICGGRVQNDDGINPCNSQNVCIDDCFIRTDDDCIAMKGLDLQTPNNHVENIVVENCTLWCDRARIFLLGHESRADYMRNIRLRHLDIIHYTMTPFLFEPGEDMRLEAVRVEDIRIHGEGQKEIARLRPTVNQYMQNKVPGHIRDAHFKNIEIEGDNGDYKFWLEGADAKHAVENVTLENLKVLGKQVGTNSPHLKVGPYTHDVRCSP
jgi:hypothetical protein